MHQLNTALAGRYEIGREIGAGGMATVYLARDLRHARDVALKLLNPELGAVLGGERFLSEIRVTANLQHPNLLPLFDSGEANGLLFYVMPFVEGETLRKRLDREKQLPVDEAVRIAVCICGALDYAHRHGVIHRDLKPENILLHEGQPLVADFGIALAVSNAGGSRITQTGLSLGTPQYMSPEQATGDRVIDGRTDIYSVGAMLYEMLTGDPPHSGSTAQAVIAHVLTEKPRSVRAERSSVPLQVEAALDRALAKLPADRWGTGREFADALAGNGARIAAPMAPSSRGWSATMVTIGVMTAAAIAAAASMATYVMTSRAHQNVGPGITARFPLSFGGDQLVPYGRSIPGLAVTPDGRSIIAIASGRGVARQIFLRPLNDISARPLSGTDGSAQPFVSPDGEWVGFFVGRQLKKVPLHGGTAVAIADVSGASMGGTWITRDQIVVESDKGLAVVSATSGSQRVFTHFDSTVGEVGQRWPCALADGNTVMYEAWAGSIATSRIGIATLSDGKSQVLNLKGSAPLGMIEGNLIYVGLNGTLMAVPFDVRRRRVGTPMALTDRINLGPLGSANATLSRNGTLVYQTGTSASQLVASDGKNLRVLVGDPRAYVYPRVSPDGKRIAVSIAAPLRTDIWIYAIADGTLTRLTTEGTINERPEWTHDGKTIIYRSDRGGRSALWERPADGSGPATPVFMAAKGVDVWEGELSPDRQSVLYRTGATASGDVYYRRLTGDTSAHAIAATTFSEWNARFSPDGRWVAYASDESGNYQVYVRPFPGPGAAMQISADGGSMPVWSHDGRRLFYASDLQLNAADLAFTPALTVVRRSKVLESDFGALNPGHAGYDVMPDGKSILLQQPIAGDVHTVVVVNLADEVRAAIGKGNGAPSSNP